MINTPAATLDFPPTLRRIRNEGACRDTQFPDDWFPTAHANVRHIVETYCKTCPVLAECLEWAVVNRESGIWGATTDIQRAKIRRRRGIT